MTKYELVGQIMSLGASKKGVEPEEKIKAKDKGVELLNQYLTLNMHDVRQPRELLISFSKWLQSKKELPWSPGHVDSFLEGY